MGGWHLGRAAGVMSLVLVCSAAAAPLDGGASGYPPAPEAAPSDPQCQDSESMDSDCPAYGDPPASEDALSDDDCQVNEIMEPDCGAWWGASSRAGREGVEALESTTGRQLDSVHVWHAVDQDEVPTEAGRQYVAEGRMLHVNVEAREFERRGKPATSYRRIIRGDFDSALQAQARGIAELGAPVFVTFDHEADGNRRYDQRGSPEEFTEAWRHIVDIYRENGAGNAIWVWNVTGLPRHFGRLPGLWPGNSYVDWLSWEAYNFTGCDAHPRWGHVQDFEEAVAPMYEWIQDTGAQHGIDAAKPVMIAEMGTVALRDSRLEGYRWYRDVPDVLRGYERIRAVQLWDSYTDSSCDLRVGQDIATELGYIKASRDPYVNIPAESREAALANEEY